jgi:hypothetical protein
MEYETISAYFWRTSKLENCLLHSKQAIFDSSRKLASTSEAASGSTIASETALLLRNGGASVSGNCKKLRKAHSLELFHIIMTSMYSTK